MPDWKFSLMLVFFMTSVTAHRESSAAGPPNVLVVLSDDHSAAHVGCYGNTDIRTPHLDKFAAASLRFDRAYVTCPQCVPSRASMMTGRSPVAIGMTRFTAPLDASVKIYPEFLREAGYYTGVAGRTFHLDGSPAFRETYESLKSVKPFASRLDYVKTAGNGPVTLQQYREFLQNVPEGRPFYLQLCFNDPHRPLDADAITNKHDPAKLKLPAHFPDTAAVREDFARYYDEIARFDGHFAEVLKELDQRKLADNTIVVFMGDNGCSQWRGKGTLYEFGIRVPLIIRWPGVIQPGATSELVSGEDLAPTLLAACGQPNPPAMTGKSFLPLLQGKPFSGRTYVFAERGAHGSAPPGVSSAFDLGRVIVSKTHKLVYNATFHLPYHPVDFGNSPMWREVQDLAKNQKLPKPLNAFYDGRPRPMIEVFDLVNDPDEFHNLHGKPEAADIEAALRKSLTNWMIQERDFLPLPAPTPNPNANPARRGRTKAAIPPPSPSQ